MSKNFSAVPSFARLVVTFVVPALLAGPLPADPPKAGKPAAPGPAGPARDGFVSGGKRIRVECFEPRGAGKRPAVILLHGVGGLDRAGPIYRGVALRLADQGFVVVLVHYLDRTGTRRADRPDLEKRFAAYLRSPDPGAKEWKDMRGHFTAWADTAADAVKYARALPGVDPERVGLLGVSMGGFLATTVAARKGLKVGCVVEAFGGLPGEVAETLTHMPPTLVIHGTLDRVVPVKEAYALCGLLHAKKLPCEVETYEVGHGFETPTGDFAWFAALSAERRAAAFLHKHLGKSPARKDCR
jgi:dienelactone hydrolase